MRAAPGYISAGDPAQPQRGEVRSLLWKISEFKRSEGEHSGWPSFYITALSLVEVFIAD